MQKLTLKRLKEMDPDEMLIPSEVAGFFRVDPKTVSRWASAGKIPSLRTLGKHRRFRAEDVLKAAEEEGFGDVGRP